LRTTEATLDPRRPLPSESEASRLLAFYEIGSQLVEQKEPQEVIRTIHRALVKHLEPDHACVLSVGKDGSYTPLTVHNLDLADRPQDKWALSHTACKRAQVEGLAVLTSDPLHDVALKHAKSIHELMIRSIICVPLGRKPVRGLIYLDNRAARRVFIPEDLEFVTALAAYTTTLLERTEEYVKTVAALELSTERFRVAQAELLRYQIVGRSPKLLEAYDALRRFAKAEAPVVLLGETGTGKELFARAYADNSPRRRKPFVPVPIPALAPTVIESELFGHVRGAFTEARQDKKGRLELAHTGVLFLDEIGDIALELQPKLLRFLDSGELYRVGDTRQRFVDALLVSATNRPLEKLVDEDRFRADLLARLGQIVTVPPLRERRDDIPRLVEHFAEMYDRGPKKKIFAEETLELLKAYRWEFNVRQLQQVVQRAMCLVDRDVILPGDLPDYMRTVKATVAAEAAVRYEARDADELTVPRPLSAVVEPVEKTHIEKTLAFTKGNKRKAIEILEISSDTFYKRLKKFGLQKRQPDDPGSRAH